MVVVTVVLVRVVAEAVLDATEVPAELVAVT